MREVQKNQKDVTVIRNIGSKSAFWAGLYRKKTKGGDMKRMEREEYPKPEIGAHDQNRCLFVCAVSHENRQPCMQRQIEHKRPIIGAMVEILKMI